MVLLEQQRRMEMIWTRYLDEKVYETLESSEFKAIRKYYDKFPNNKFDEYSFKNKTLALVNKILKGEPEEVRHRFNHHLFQKYDLTRYKF
jgi:hypothetical protein